MKLDQALREFLEYLEVEKNRGELTIRNYQFYLGRFIKYAVPLKITDTADISAEAIRSYRLWLHRKRDRHGEELKVSSQNYHLIAMRAWFKYLAKRDVPILAAEKIELGKIPERSVSFLENSELKRFLEAPLVNIKNNSDDKPSKRQNIIYLRDKAILEMLFSTGLRVSELAKLNRDLVNLKEDNFTVRGKGKKLRMVFLSDDAKKALGNYLNERADVAPWLFIRHDIKSDAESLTPRSIQRLVEKYARIAGITKHVSPHTLRHTFATDLLKAGADIRSVQTLLGHASITTTQIYTHITDERLKDVYKTYHDKANHT